MVAFSSETPASAPVPTPSLPCTGPHKSERFQRNRPSASVRRQYLNIDGLTIYFDELDEKEVGELLSLQEKIDDLSKCLTETADAAVGDTQIKARDKLRHAHRFLDRIAELLGEPYEDDNPDNSAAPSSQVQDYVPREVEPQAGMVTPGLHKYVKKERDQLRSSIDNLMEAMRQRLSPDLVEQVMRDAGLTG